MNPISRRKMIKSTAAALAGSVAWRSSAADRPAQTAATHRIPLLFVADLYHPPQDPDDHIDLATVGALPEFDLRGVMLDCSRKFIEAAPHGWDLARDPGFVPVAQLACLVGRAIPVAMGPLEPLVGPEDKAFDRPKREQAAIVLLLELLAASAEPVTIILTGSARIVTAAFNRDPDLLRAKTRAVVLNAGATGGPKREWNVMLDPAAFVGLWRSGLPIHWYPCATETGAFNQNHERGTHWRSTHADLFRDLPVPLSAWFSYAFSNSGRGDIIHALAEASSGEAVWQHALAGPRNLWSTASLVLSAGRCLAQTPAGWRFIPANEVGSSVVWPMRLDPVIATAAGEGTITWELTDDLTSLRLFGRKTGPDYGTAMTEALNALLREIPVG